MTSVGLPLLGSLRSHVGRLSPPTSSRESSERELAPANEGVKIALANANASASETPVRWGAAALMAEGPKKYPESLMTYENGNVGGNCPRAQATDHTLGRSVASSLSMVV